MKERPHPPFTEEDIKNLMGDGPQFPPYDDGPMRQERWDNLFDPFDGIVPKVIRVLAILSVTCAVAWGIAWTVGWVKESRDRMVIEERIRLEETGLPYGVSSFDTKDGMRCLLYYTHDLECYPIPTSD